MTIRALEHNCGSYIASLASIIVRYDSRLCHIDSDATHYT